MSNDQLFLKLQLPDIKRNLRELINSETKLKVWNSDRSACKVTMSDFKDDAFSIFEIDQLVEGQEYFISFQHRSMNYYLKARKELEKLRVSSDIFRSEKRRNLRLLVYPILKAYVYFQFDNEDKIHDNVISFNRFKTDEHEIFKEFDETVAGSPELSGERILDISKQGLSFVCTKSEYNYLSENIPSTAIVVLDGQSINISEIRIRYNVDYLDVRLEDIMMKKVGIEFKEDEKINQFIESLDDDSIILSSIDEEFQKFISTEE